MVLDIACIVFVCVTANHLGLISAIEDFFGIRIPIVNCPKCASFWSVLVYMITTHDAITTLAVSFLASYTAVWMELLEGLIDTIYLKLYGKIITDYSDDTPAADTDSGDTEGTVP